MVRDVALRLLLDKVKAINFADLFLRKHGGQAVTGLRSSGALSTFHGDFRPLIRMWFF
jgi:hypothetical protein